MALPRLYPGKPPLSRRFLVSRKALKFLEVTELRRRGRLLLHCCEKQKLIDASCSCGMGIATLIFDRAAVQWRRALEEKWLKLVLNFGTRFCNLDLLGAIAQRSPD